MESKLYRELQSQKPGDLSLSAITDVKYERSKLIPQNCPLTALHIHAYTQIILTMHININNNIYEGRRLLAT